MIERAQDYQLVTPVGVIDGGILPARDVAGDGSAHAIRAEDLCFALEAVKERDFQQILTSLPPPAHVVRRFDWNAIWEALRKDCFGELGSVLAIDSGETFAAIPYTTGSGGSLEFSDLYPTAVLPSCYTADVTSPVEDNKFWRRFYYDLKRADRLYVPGASLYNLGTWSATGTYTTVTGTTYSISSADRGYITSNSAGTFTRAIGYVYGTSTFQRRIYGISNGTMTRVSLPLLGNVSSAVAVVAYRMELLPRGAGSSWLQYHFARSYPCSIGPTGVSVSGDMFLQNYDILAECENLGYTFPTDETSSRYGEVTIEIAATYLVVNYDFRTNNLNSPNSRAFGWNWTP